MKDLNNDKVAHRQIWCQYITPSTMDIQIGSSSHETKLNLYIELGLTVKMSTVPTYGHVPRWNSLIG